MTAAPVKRGVNERKWGRPLMQAGWTAVPNVLIEAQQALKLDAMDVNIILHLAYRWWVADHRPVASKSAIAAAMGVHPMTVQRRLRQLERRGLIERETRRAADGGNLANRYHFGGLIEKATALVAER